MRGSVFTELYQWLLPAAILGGGWAIFAYVSQKPPTPTREEVAEAVPKVQVITIAEQTGGLNIDVDGLVVPFREIELAAEVAGNIMLQSEECRAGNHVSQGTLLFQIDDRDYQLEVRRLEHQLAQAETEIEELEVEIRNSEALREIAQQQLELQKNDLRRLERLQGMEKQKRTGLRIVTSNEIDQERRNVLTAQNTLTGVDNQLALLRTRRQRLTTSKELAQTQLDKARLDLERTKIRSPVDGLIVEEAAEEGSFVQRGTVLVKIEDTSRAEVHCSLQMDELAWIWQRAEGRRTEPPLESQGFQQNGYSLPPTPVSVFYHWGGHDFRWDGTLTRLAGLGVDTASRMLPCRVVVENPRGGLNVDAASDQQAMQPPPLLRGMFVDVRIHAEPDVSLVRIPAQAVRPGNVIWHYRDGKLSIQEVHVAEALDDILILDAAASGLAPGDKVIISPLTLVEDGMAVQESQPQ